MGWAQILTNPWLWGGAVVLLIVSRAQTGQPPPGLVRPPVASDCPYPPAGLTPPAKSRPDLVARTERAILEYHQRVNFVANRMGFVPDTMGKNYSRYLAEFLVDSALRNDVSLALLVSLSRAESAHRPTVTSGRYEVLGFSDRAIRQAIEHDWAIGPLQVKPFVFPEVGLPHPRRWLGDPTPWRHPARLRDAVEAGARYLVRQQRRFGDWCSALHAYQVGPGAFQRGRRNQPYVDRIMRWTLGEHSHLRT